ncbi:MAG: aminotransferase class V-fold PLP-dependent enzyme [Lachnospiraceae bacterium]|nr:aminotransferase class V-fold PLP-dependent enzyme [Lachnospiraceae bacterium]
MSPIYLDNAATSFPKPACVPEAVTAFMTGCGCNINRGGYASAYSAASDIFDARDLLADFFGGDDPGRVIFTKNVTESLNIILKGLLKKGDHVLVSSMEHNAVMRPLVQLEAQGVSFTRVPCHSDGTMDPDTLEQYLTPATRAVVMTHASNVCGTVLPAAAIGDFCRRKGLIFIMDSAQTAGILPVNMKEMGIHALAFTGHKGLLGPQGTGGFVLEKDLVDKIEPILSGGTGSFSHSEEVPLVMPDRFEPGTLNLPGIMGLYAGLKWLTETGIDVIRQKEEALTAHFLEGLKPLENEGFLKPVGLPGAEGRMAVVSVNMLTMDNADAAFRLDSEHGIMTRVGLHCAPSAHKTLGTYPAGTVRFSFGYFNTENDIECALKALWEVCHGI